MMEVDGLDGDLRKFIGIAQPQARPAGDPVFGWLVGGMVGWLVGSGKDCRQLQEQVMLLPSAWFAMAINGRIELLALQLNASLVLGVHSQDKLKYKLFF